MEKLVRSNTLPKSLPTPSHSMLSKSTWALDLDHVKIEDTLGTYAWNI